MFEEVVAVYPSGAQIPEGLLRISVVFARPVGRRLFEGIALRLDDGAVIPDAFVQMELWSPDQRTLTLLLHPGRVKSGLIAHETLGRALRADTGVSLVLDGVPLHRWEVTGERWSLPSPATWTLGEVVVGTDQPLVITFGSPIDALSRDMIIVINAADEQPERVEGQASLVTGEREWRFTPDDVWRAGAHRVLVHPRLENPCGDELGEPFEHPVGEGLGAARRAASIHFTVAECG